MARAFECLEESKGPDRTSWKSYKTFLQDLLQDLVTRTSTLACWYNEATQCYSQMVIQFVNYLDELEAELPAYGDEYQC